MSKPKWSADGSHIPSLEPHTKAKHLILEKYIENLVYTLYAKTRRGETNFTFIDGFCGGGIYKDDDTGQEWEGSPSRIIKSVREAHRKSKRTYPEPLNIKYIFIDSKESHLNCLKNYSMSKAGLEKLIDENPHTYNDDFGQIIEQCVFLKGEFEDFLNYCVMTINFHKGHSFFFLDPFGWTDVSMKTIRTINSIKGSEILYTYMIDYIRRFLIERYTSQKHGFKEVLEADGYYEAANLEDSSVGEQCYLRDQTVKLFLERGQSKYVFTFALIPRGEKLVKYYLLHLSQNLTALEVIKECFDYENNLNYQYHYEIYGYGFNTANYYNQNQTKLELNITKDSYEVCMNKLDKDVGRLIFNNPDGIDFKQILQKTMPLNPANRRLYNEYLNKYINEQELEVLRNGKLLKSKKIKFRKNDIIKVVQKYQTSLFHKSNFFK
ncbi:MAG: three-Cys-motif partner protein TcmP [Symploca sp. SIO2D2]|nr:three-Cys-motif partner protein TcmP [Symploca sp. SIO2D2]